jgi:hypothetical protein
VVTTSLSDVRAAMPREIAAAAPCRALEWSILSGAQAGTGPLASQAVAIGAADGRADRRRPRHGHQSWFVCTAQERVAVHSPSPEEKR